MEKKYTFMKGWIRFWVFIGSLFCDQAGSMSQKRVIPLVSLVMLWRITNEIINASEKITNGDMLMNVIYALIFIILGSMGLTIPEWFSKKGKETPSVNVSTP